MRFTICRVIGNELPPRDVSGEKIKWLEFLLERPDQAPRRWVVNHLHDAAYRDAVLTLLERSRETFHEMHFDSTRYAGLATSRERICYAININRARNTAIELARAHSDFIVCLDQDCFFTNELWTQAVDAIVHDQRQHGERQHYGLIMRRVVRQRGRYVIALRNHEPQIVFRRDASLLFDPDLPFGENDKAMLLQRLGYGPPPAFAITGSACRTVGHVLHLPSNDPRSECDGLSRQRLRSESLARLMARVDSNGGNAAAL